MPPAIVARLNQHQAEIVLRFGVVRDAAGSLHETAAATSRARGARTAEQQAERVVRLRRPTSGSARRRSGQQAPAMAARPSPARAVPAPARSARPRAARFRASRSSRAQIRDAEIDVDGGGRRQQRDRALQADARRRQVAAARAAPCRETRDSRRSADPAARSAAAPRQRGPSRRCTRAPRRDCSARRGFRAQRDRPLRGERWPTASSPCWPSMKPSRLCASAFVSSSRSGLCQSSRAPREIAAGRAPPAPARRDRRRTARRWDRSSSRRAALLLQRDAQRVVALAHLRVELERPLVRGDRAVAVRRSERSVWPISYCDRRVVGSASATVRRCSSAPSRSPFSRSAVPRFRCAPTLFGSSASAF